MATTTTIAAIRDQMISKIEAISPASLTDKPFRRSPRRLPLRRWATETNQSSATFRKFEIITGAASELPLHDDAALHRSEQVTIAVAYPLLPGLYGTDDLDDLEAISRKDAQLIRDTVFSPDNYLAGQHAAFVTIQALDRSDSNVWFRELSIDVLYNEVQSL